MSESQFFLTLQEIEDKITVHHLPRLWFTSSHNAL